MAVDAGTHLASITRILERDLPLVSAPVELKAPTPTESVCDGRASPISISSPISEEEVPPEPIVLENGPFAGASLPHASARANAAHIVRSHVSTYLITHPHLDHLSGFAINTAAFHATSRPKTLAALPFTVDAIKKHIFNDVIWPNMTDEDGGVGFVTFQRLKEGGDLMLGEGEGRGYIEVCEGLGVKGFKISHGNCMKSNSNPAPSHHRPSLSNLPDPTHPTWRTNQDHGRTVSISHVLASDMGTPTNNGYFSPLGAHGIQSPPNGYTDNNPTSSTSNHLPPASVVDSTAYFIRDYATSTELLVFGDVEPDSVSSSPRLAHLWGEAAQKIVSGVLRGIFIECSYDDSQGDAILFGHMAPRHLVHELSILAHMVREERNTRIQEKAARKRKRSAHSASGVGGVGVGAGASAVGLTTASSQYDNKKRSKSVVSRSSSMQTRRISLPTALAGAQAATAAATAAAAPTMNADSSPTPSPSKALPAPMTLGAMAEEAQSQTQTQSQTPTQMHGQTQTHAQSQIPPLRGVKVVVIHVKDTMKDGPHVSERILRQLEAHALELRDVGGPAAELGCEFLISESGKDYWF